MLQIQGQAHVQDVDAIHMRLQRVQTVATFYRAIAASAVQPQPDSYHIVKAALCQIDTAYAGRRRRGM
jgi:hypothetical protein